jgi:exodeoxyribonuclease VII small subunit
MSEEDDDGEPEESTVDPDRVDERIGRLEAIVRALEAGEVAPDERAARIAEGKALVADLERDLETVEEVVDDDTEE